MHKELNTGGACGVGAGFLKATYLQAGAVLELVMQPDLVTFSTALRSDGCGVTTYFHLLKLFCVIVFPCWL